eukprot:562299-Rhodomonas_salina.3
MVLSISALQCLTAGSGLQYPYKPPEFMFLCPQGRFEVGKKICLTISQHHPEQWQPSWDIRTGACSGSSPTLYVQCQGFCVSPANSLDFLPVLTLCPPPLFSSSSPCSIVSSSHRLLPYPLLCLSTSPHLTSPPPALSHLFSSPQR